MSKTQKLIKERQAKTGESYQTAHRYVTGAHRKGVGTGSEPPSDDRRVFAREDLLRAAKAAPDREVATPGTTHREEAHISYERTDTAVTPNRALAVFGPEYVTMIAVMFAGQRAWLFAGLVDALWGGPEPKDLAQLAEWLKQDLSADSVEVRSFKGNIADITAHWIAEPRTINQAAVEALAEQIMGIEAAEPAPEFGPWFTHGTHERPANLLQLALMMAGVPAEDLKKWDCQLLGLRRISGGASADLRVAQQQAADNARIGAFALDLGHKAISLPREKGEALQKFLIENQIPFERVRSLGAEWLAKKTGTKARYRGM
jgi:hypothetical protein